MQGSSDDYEIKVESATNLSHNNNNDNQGKRWIVKATNGRKVLYNVGKNKYVKMNNDGDVKGKGINHVDDYFITYYNGQTGCSEFKIEFDEKGKYITVNTNNNKIIAATNAASASTFRFEIAN